MTFGLFYVSNDVNISWTDHEKGEKVWILGTQTPSYIEEVEANSHTGKIRYLCRVRKDAVYPYNSDTIWVDDELIRPWCED